MADKADGMEAGVGEGTMSVRMASYAEATRLASATSDAMPWSMIASMDFSCAESVMGVGLAVREESKPPIIPARGSRSTLAAVGKAAI